MKISAKIHEISPTKMIKDTFRKREFIVIYADKPEFPQYIKFELIQDNCDYLDEFKAGDDVEINFDLRGREWVNPKGEKVYFNSLLAWKIAKTGETPMTDVPPPAGDDDFPF
jgi:hypothetical protein